LAATSNSIIQLAKNKPIYHGRSSKKKKKKKKVDKGIDQTHESTNIALSLPRQNPQKISREKKKKKQEINTTKSASLLYIIITS
jgi:hypothetical protein